MKVTTAVTQRMVFSKSLANRIRLICGMWVALASLAPATGHARGQTTVNPDAAKLKAFNDRVQQYVDLQKTLDGQLPSIGKTDDPARIESHRKALADAISNARREAKPGDIFGNTAEQFRLIIRQDARRRSVRDALAAMSEVPQTTPPRVNAEYPERAPLATMPPLILTRLQRLPDGLEYRFMGRDLILRDAKANLIIDLVHEAVPTIRR